MKRVANRPNWSARCFGTELALSTERRRAKLVAVPTFVAIARASSASSSRSAVTWALWCGLACALTACGGQSQSDSERDGQNVNAGETESDVLTEPGSEPTGTDDLSEAPELVETLPLSEARIEAALVDPAELSQLGGISASPDEYTPEGTTQLADTEGTAWRMIDVPAASNAPTLIRTPSGWFALSSRNMGEGKAIGEWQSTLYRSPDGVHWESVPFAADRADTDVRDITYGEGRYVMVARTYGGEFRSLFFVSSDGEDWHEVDGPELDQSQALGVLDFAGGKFFAFGFGVLAVSENAEDWVLMGSDIIQFGAAAYGNDRYVLAGNGPMMVSEDGWSWLSNDVDCAIPGACITDPSGNVGQSYQRHLRFIDGHFYSDQTRSTDGVVWEALPERTPAAFEGGRFIGGGGYSLNTWTPESAPEPLHVIRPSQAAATAAGRRITSVGVLGRDEPLPETVSVEFEDGLTCETASCLIVDSRMYLVPPEGTPALPDRIPRDADGQALLSDDCPYSAMIICADYTERRDCQCVPEAPAAPNHCEDVSQFQCAGQFEHWPDEWPIDEVAEGGCDCNAVDPNQPPTFGIDCEEGSDVCQSPLACLPIDYPSTYGPIPQPFICTSECSTDADCPTWEATGYCAGEVSLRCSNGTCQPRDCE